MCVIATCSVCMYIEESKWKLLVTSLSKQSLFELTYLFPTALSKKKQPQVVTFLPSLKRRFLIVKFLSAHVGQNKKIAIYFNSISASSYIQEWVYSWDEAGGHRPSPPLILLCANSCWAQGLEAKTSFWRLLWGLWFLDILLLWPDISCWMVCWK